MTYGRHANKLAANILLRKSNDQRAIILCKAFSGLRLTMNQITELTYGRFPNYQLFSVKVV